LILNLNTYFVGSDSVLFISCGVNDGQHKVSGQDRHELDAWNTASCVPH